MALSRSMKNLMHDSAMARRGGGNPNPGDDVSGTLPGQQARLKSKVMQARAGAGGGMAEAIRGRGTRYDPAEDRARRGPRGPVMPRGGVMGGPARSGKPRPGAGTFGFAAGGGGGTPALQQTAASARMQAMKQAAAPGGRVPRTDANVVGTTAARARGRPAALAKPRGQTIASRIGGQQGPPARRGGMARALGSGGSRRRMLR